MKTINNYILEKLKIDKNTKFKKEGIEAIIEEIFDYIKEVININSNDYKIDIENPEEYDNVNSNTKNIYFVFNIHILNNSLDKKRINDKLCSKLGLKYQCFDRIYSGLEGDEDIIKLKFDVDKNDPKYFK